MHHCVGGAAKIPSATASSAAARISVPLLLQRPYSQATTTEPGIAKRAALARIVVTWPALTPLFAT